MTARRGASLFLYQPPGDAGLAPLAVLRSVSWCRHGGITLGARAGSTHRGVPAIPRGEAGLHLDARFVAAKRVSIEGRPVAGFSEGRVAWLRLDGARAKRLAEASDPAHAAWEIASDLPREEAEGRWILAPWDLVPREDDDLLARDLASTRPSAPAAALAKGVHRAGTSISVHKSARVDPGAFLDARDGAVVVEAGARIGANAVLEGPVLVCEGAVVKPHAHLRGSVIGREVRAGGEISASIVDDYSNKAHFGFLGHSIVGSWVNIGAGATVSNLKNTYGEITSGADGKERTGRVFFGCAIGDFAKIGIQVAIATGTLVGVAAHLVGPGPFPKNVPSFFWPGGRLHIEKAIEIARRMRKRRGLDLSPEEAEGLRAAARGACAR